jgi:hypothetical protein
VIEALIVAMKIALAAFAAISVALPLWRDPEGLRFCLAIYRSISFGLIAKAAGVVLLTIPAVFALWQVPGLSWGWYKLLSGHYGNAMIAPITDLSDAGFWPLRLLPVVFIVLFFAAMPLLVRYEEQSFREGITDPRAIFWKSLRFGLIHCIVGVPLAAGLALTIPGLFYGFTYRRVALERGASAALFASTAAHTAYNGLIVCLILPPLVIALLYP